MRARLLLGRERDPTRGRGGACALPPDAACHTPAPPHPLPRLPAPAARVQGPARIAVCVDRARGAVVDSADRAGWRGCVAAGVLCVGAAAGSRAPTVRASVRPGGAGLRSHAAAVHPGGVPGAAPGALGMQAPGMQGVDPMNGGGDHAQDKEKLYQLVAELSREETRETALLELSKKRETFPDLAPILWHSFGTTATLLQEIVCIYPLLSPPQLTGALFSCLRPSLLALPRACSRQVGPALATAAACACARTRSLPRTEGLCVCVRCGSLSLALALCLSLSHTHTHTAAHASNRVCNALALLQCVASHQDTRQLFLKAHIPLFLYPFLNTISKTRPFEYLRLTSLGVIGALVKMDDSDVINFLLTTEIIPLCLRIMENGSDLSKTVATFIVQKILLDDTGLNYICATAERFFAVSNVLSNMIQGLTKEPSTRLLKHIIRCYLRLSENARARDALRHCLPEQLWDANFTSCLREDQSTKRWLNQLMFAVGVDPGAQGQQMQQHKGPGGGLAAGPH